MKLSDLDSRELANKGAKCRIYNPKTGEQTGASITMLGADSTVYKAKTKEISERRRLEGKTMTQEQAEEDSREILAACATGWEGITGDDGKELPFNEANIRAALEVPEVYRQLGEFAMRRANFLPSASAS